MKDKIYFNLTSDMKMCESYDFLEEIFAFFSEKHKLIMRKIDSWDEPDLLLNFYKNESLILSLVLVVFPKNSLHVVLLIEEPFDFFQKKEMLTTIYDFLLTQKGISNMMLLDQSELSRMNL